MQGVDHFWTRLMLIKKRQTQKYHLWTRLLLVQKCQTPKHQQRTLQDTNKKRNNSMYWRIRSQAQVWHIRHQANMIHQTTENIKSKDVVKIKGMF